MDFYDDLAPLYHLIFPNWSNSIQRQGEQLDLVIQSAWPGHRKVLDVSCGIGTQALALAARGYCVVGSDLSAKEVERARREADLRGLTIDFSVGDMRAAHEDHGTGYDLVISCDNSVPHLLNDDDLLLAFQQFFACLRPGGGCVITVRDYDKEERGTNLVKHYGARVEDGKRYVLFQVWDFDGDHYDLSFFVVEDELATGRVKTHAMRSRYYAVSVERLCELMRRAGFESVRRLDDVFYQPILLGAKPATAKLAQVSVGSNTCSPHAEHPQMTTIAENTGFVTLINVFTVDPANQQELLTLLERATDTSVRHVPGFVSAALHGSVDGTKVAMYAQWQSAEHYQAMRSNPVASPFLEQALAIAKFDPGMYEVVKVFSAPSKSEGG